MMVQSTKAFCCIESGNVSKHFGYLNKKYNCPFHKRENSKRKPGAGTDEGAMKV